MIPRTFPSTLNPITRQRQLVALFLNNITGLKRWSDYIPVNFGKGTTLVEGRYDNNGFIAIQEITSGIGLVPFKDYVPVFFDPSATDTWQVSDVGFIPYGASGVSIAPSLDLVFTRSDVLDSRITFTRSTTATRTNSSGVIESVAINGARFDYDPVTQAPKGLLIEESRTNLVKYSEQFDNAAWTKTASTITANTIVSPDGALDADKLIETATTGAHFVLYGVAALTGAYSVTCYVKAAERTNVMFVVLGGTTQRGVGFNLTTGTTYTEAIGGIVPPDLPSSMTNVGNGWWRCQMSWTANGQTAARIYTDGGTGTGSTTGDGYSGLYIWGAQLEAGAFATSYIPTVASQVTRAADAAVMTGTNFSSWYRADEGTLYGEFDWMGLSSNDYFFAINNSGTSNLIALGVSAAPIVRFIVLDNTVTQASISGPTPVVNIPFKTVGAYQVNNFRAATNGTLGTADTSGTVPTGMSEVSLTSSFGPTNNGANGHIRKVAYYPKRLTDTELQGLTS